MMLDRDPNDPRLDDYHPFLLYRVALHSFKSVKYADIALRPLSIVVGANSSGKSTLLQALAATVQTIKAGAAHNTFKLNGELVRLGSYGDVLNRHLQDSVDPIMIGFRIRIPSRFNLPLLANSDTNKDVGDYALDSAVFLTAPDKEDNTARIEAGSIIMSSDSVHKEVAIWTPRDIPQLNNESVTAIVAQAAEQGVKVERLSQLYGSKQIQLKYKVHDKIVQFALSESHVFYSWNLNQKVVFLGHDPDIPESTNTASQDKSSLLSALVSTTEDSDVQWSLCTVDDISNGLFSSGVSYLGPLRFTDERPTVGPSSGVTGLDVRGEYTAAVLKREADKWAQLPMPDGHERYVAIGDALNSWLQWFDLADAVATRELGRLGSEVTVSPRGASMLVDLSSVGVGVSQVLPVILMCLLSNPADLLILEQPELHLHPALQKRMADFLLTFVRAGRQVIVETHSDHLVNQLRYQVAADQTDEIQKLVKLIFAEQTDGITTYRESEINEYGGMSEDWPDGFLDISAKSIQDLVRHGLRKWKGRNPRPSDVNETSSRR